MFARLGAVPRAIAHHDQVGVNLELGGLVLGHLVWLYLITRYSMRVVVVNSLLIYRYEVVVMVIAVVM